MKNQLSILLSLLILLSIVNTACDPYQKLLSSTDFDLKYKKTKEYYNTGEYFKSIPLFEELMTVYKGTKDIEELYYYYAYAHFGQKDYFLAAHYFRQFGELYGSSIYAENAAYMHAISYSKMSPSPSLEQTNSQKATDAFQSFINKYPKSEKVAIANEKIDEMRAKLEEKAFQNAELYYQIGSYKAATTALSNLLKEFPDTKKQEEIRYLILRSHYLLSENSVLSKKEARYSETINAYLSMIDKFPKTKYVKEIERIYNDSQQTLKQLKKQEKELEQALKKEKEEKLNQQ